MRTLKWIVFFVFLLVGLSQDISAATTDGVVDASAYGFSPDASGVENTKALQKAVEQGGTIRVNQPGIYKVSGTVYIGDNTSLIFGNGVYIEKSAENGAFTHVFLNKGALTRTYNHHIGIIGLHLKVNGVDKWMDDVYGLRGHVSFFYVKDIKIENFRCYDLNRMQFCLHICTFEDLQINDAIIKGKKDGIHLGPGKRFRISNVVFNTKDDAIALVPGDWVSANPEFGNLENGIIENCTDIPDSELEGSFAKIVPSGWVIWKAGMQVRHGTSVVANGRIYRVVEDIDDKTYISNTCPDFEEGMKEIDGVNWLMFQKDTIRTAQVRNIVFRDIFLYSIRTPFQIMCYDNMYEHSYYPGAPKPMLRNFMLDNINFLGETARPLMGISAPCDFIIITNSKLKNNSIRFNHSKDFDSYPPTHIGITNSVFTQSGESVIIENNSPFKEIYLNTSGNTVLNKDTYFKVKENKGKIYVNSDLPGL
ncbi:hypothetical protein [Bacteroides xylanisolvens]|uniref:hypothetical protein n=1 Tax=Bacteroides xylanisolvens TaxID=371601 RepID=UPI001899722D|nr:hypothetical protein [Bacteroides xylanisolvens]